MERWSALIHGKHTISEDQRGLIFPVYACWCLLRRAAFYFTFVTPTDRESIPMRGPGASASLLFKLIVPATAIFIITIMSLIAVVFSDQQAPVAKFLNKHGTKLLMVEFAAVVGLSFMAMTVDRIRTLRQIRNSSKENPERKVAD